MSLRKEDEDDRDVPEGLSKLLEATRRVVGDPNVDIRGERPQWWGNDACLAAGLKLDDVSGWMARVCELFGIEPLDADETVELTVHQFAAVLQMALLTGLQY